MHPFCTLHLHLLLILRFSGNPRRRTSLPPLITFSLPPSCHHPSFLSTKALSSSRSQHPPTSPLICAYIEDVAHELLWKPADGWAVDTRASREGRQEGSSVRRAFQPAVVSRLLSGVNRGPALGSSLRDKLDHLPVFNSADPVCCQRASLQQVQQRFGTSTTTHLLTIPEL